MPLAQHHRNAIHNGLDSLCGAEAMDAWLSNVPATDLDRPATEGFVQAQVAGVRGEVAEVRVEVAQLRGEVAEVRVEVAQLRTEMADRFHSQTIWIVNTMIAGLALAAGIGSLVGVLAS